MAKARTPRQSWIDEGLRVLEAGGPDAVRVEALAKNLGVTKGGFYGYFADRRELLEAMLDAWESRSIDDVLAQVERESDPKSRAVRARDLTFSEELLPIDLAMRDWARRDSGVADRLQRVDDRRLDLLRTVIGMWFSDPLEVEARSTLAMLTSIGAHFVTLDHHELSRDEVLTRAASIILGDGDDRASTKRPSPSRGIGL